jgi:hypothetical protein
MGHIREHAVAILCRIEFESFVLSLSCAYEMDAKNPFDSQSHNSLCGSRVRRGREAMSWSLRLSRVERGR